MLSDFPDFHNLSFLNSKHAVQTCVLSPRWKHLWKHIPTLILHSSEFSTTNKLAIFVTKILTLRDTSTSLNALDFELRCNFEPQRSLKEIVNYACSHNKQLGICVKGDSRVIFHRISALHLLFFVFTVKVVIVIIVMGTNQNFGNLWICQHWLASLLCNLKTLKVKPKSLPFGTTHTCLRTSHLKKLSRCIPEGIVDVLLQNSSSTEVHITDYSSPLEIVHWVEMDLKTIWYTIL
jgi:hypothetical protein